MTSLEVEFLHRENRIPVEMCKAFAFKISNKGRVYYDICMRFGLEYNLQRGGSPFVKIGIFPICTRATSQNGNSLLKTDVKLLLDLALWGS